jgi:hypothetical protein
MGKRRFLTDDNRPKIESSVGVRRKGDESLGPFVRRSNKGVDGDSQTGDGDELASSVNSMLNRMVMSMKP